jgi:23S rRNA (cytidine1920-2'-O)/16S rRNA (cytidine1409-2'-O)-methyltransferase
VGKGGVVRNAAVHERVVGEVCAWLERRGWAVAGTTTSPITGPEGNVEFLVAAVRDAGSAGEQLPPRCNSV